MSHNQNSSGSVHSSPYKQHRVAVPLVPINDADTTGGIVNAIVSSDDEDDQIAMQLALIEVEKAKTRYEQRQIAIAEAKLAIAQTKARKKAKQSSAASQASAGSIRSRSSRGARSEHHVSQIVPTSFEGDAVQPIADMDPILDQSVHVSQPAQADPVYSGNGVLVKLRIPFR